MTTHNLVVATRSKTMRLASEHFRDFAREYGVPLNLEFVDVGSPEDLPAAIQDLGAHSVRLDPDLSAHWLAQCPIQPLAVSRAQAADLFVRTGSGVWAPELLLEKAVHDVIVREGKSMEINDWAYVIGDGAELRTVAGVCLSLGYRRLCLIGEREDDLALQRDLLGTLYMGCEIVLLLSHALTLQTVEASLLVNAVDLDAKPDLSNDLAYFNFMRKGGLVVDFKSSRAGNAMLTEATRAGLRVIPIFEATGATEVLLAERLGFAHRIRPAEYLASWLSVLRGQGSENQPSVQ